MWPRATQGISEVMLQIFLYAYDMGLLSDRRSGLCDVLMGVAEVALTCGMYINIDHAQACVLVKFAFGHQNLCTISQLPSKRAVV